jgi:creatinine amidohydrolase
MKLAELKSPEVAALPRETVVVLPVASIEQHGPHLPVGTDSMIGAAVVDALDTVCNGQLLVAPILSFGCSEHHMFAAGTLTVDHDIFRDTVLATIDSMHRHGFRRFLVSNSHGGNMAVCGVIGEMALARWPDADVVISTWFRLASTAIADLVEGEGLTVGHAAEFETSVMLHCHPDLVDMSLAIDDGIVASAPELRGDLLRGSAAGLSKPFNVITRNGVMGRATLANAEKGREILARTAGALAELVANVWPDAPR